MRFETWIIGALLITLTFSAFIGFYMEQADSDHYNTIGTIPDDFRNLYGNYSLNSSQNQQIVENHTSLLINMTEDSQNAPIASTGGSDDMMKSQTNILKKAWNFFSDATQQLGSIKNHLFTATRLLGIPLIITWTVIGIITTMLLFAFLNAIFGRNL
jgi:hypothetical protein